MKRLLTTLLSFCAFAGICLADGNEEIISVDQLPPSALQLVRDSFSDKDVEYVLCETELFSKEYELKFTDGTVVEFDTKGNWTKIDCVSKAVPCEVVPAEVKSAVEKNFPQAVIFEIEHDRRGYEVKLSNGIELEFDRKFQMKSI